MEALLDFSKIETVLEFGCGLGIDGSVLAKRLKPGGKYLGVDINPSFVKNANTLFEKLNLADIARAEVADILKMPITPNSEDLVLVNRVLEHLPDPLSVIRRVFDVLKPGGQFLCIEPDWTTFSLNHPDMELSTRVMNTAALYAVTSGTAGIHLREWFVKAGFIIKNMDTFSSPGLDFDLVNMGMGLDRIAKFVVELGKVSQEEATRWLEGLKQKSDEGFFFATGTIIAFVGLKPKE